MAREVESVQNKLLQDLPNDYSDQSRNVLNMQRRFGFFLRKYLLKHFSLTAVAGLLPFSTEKTSLITCNSLQDGSVASQCS